MPYRASSKCPTPGCRALTQGGRCEDCKRKARSLSRAEHGAEHHHLYDTWWRYYRAHYLRLHPYCECVDCVRLKRDRRATVVDHIKPHRGDRALFRDPGNHRAMAKACHDRKTATQDGGFGNARKG